MLLDKLSVLIIFIEFDKHRSKLNSIVTIFSVFEEYVLKVFFEDVESKVDWEKVLDFDLKGIPDFLLISCIPLHFFLIEHGNVWNCINKLFIAFEIFSGLSYWSPVFLCGFFFCSDSEFFHVRSQVDSGVIDDIFLILKLGEEVQILSPRYNRYGDDACSLLE